MEVVCELHALSESSQGHVIKYFCIVFTQMTFEQICQDVHMLKTSGQQVFIESRNRPSPLKQDSLGKHHQNVTSAKFKILALITDFT